MIEGSCLCSAQGAWTLDKDENDIQVYTRRELDSDFKSFKAVTVLQVSAEDILGVLRDADRYEEWYGFTKTSQLLERQGNVQYNYVETVFPWPYKNRDMVYRMSIDTSNQAVTKVSLEGLPHHLPDNKGIVRMQVAKGYLLLATIDKETTITYVFHSEPGASVPAWLANASIAELPYQTLLGLRSELEAK
ncbi:MAG: START domain-containing protein [Bacteroidota bacterium]